MNTNSTLFLSLVDVGPIEKCLTELKTPNVLPGEREDIKSQVKSAVIDGSKEFSFCFHLLQKAWVGTVQCQFQFSTRLSKGFYRS